MLLKQVRHERAAFRITKRQERKNAAKNRVGYGINEDLASSETQLIPFHLSLTRKMKKEIFV